jgi:hypothetical protein
MPPDPASNAALRRQNSSFCRRPWPLIARCNVHPATPRWHRNRFTDMPLVGAPSAVASGLGIPTWATSFWQPSPRSGRGREPQRSAGTSAAQNAIVLWWHSTTHTILAFSSGDAIRAAAFGLKRTNSNLWPDTEEALRQHEGLKPPWPKICARHTNGASPGVCFAHASFRGALHSGTSFLLCCGPEVRKLFFG